MNSLSLGITLGFILIPRYHSIGPFHKIFGTPCTWCPALTIENFLERPEKKNDSIESTVFSVKGPGDMITNWYLDLDPKGQDLEPGDEDEDEDDCPYDLPVYLYIQYR